jgi:hypothetical protein
VSGPVSEFSGATFFVRGQADSMKDCVSDTTLKFEKGNGGCFSGQDCSTETVHNEEGVRILKGANRYKEPLADLRISSACRDDVQPADSSICF